MFYSVGGGTEPRTIHKLDKTKTKALGCNPESTRQFTGRLDLDVSFDILGVLWQRETW